MFRHECGQRGYVGVSRADLRKSEYSISRLNRQLEHEVLLSCESSESPEPSESSIESNIPSKRRTRQDPHFNRPPLPDKTLPASKRRNLMDSPLDLLLPEPVRQAPPPRPLEPLGGNPDTAQILTVRVRNFAE